MLAQVTYTPLDPVQAMLDALGPLIFPAAVVLAVPAAYVAVRWVWGFFVPYIDAEPSINRSEYDDMLGNPDYNRE